MSYSIETSTIAAKALWTHNGGAIMRTASCKYTDRSHLLWREQNPALVEAEQQLEATLQTL